MTACTAFSRNRKLANCPISLPHKLTGSKSKRLCCCALPKLSASLDGVPDEEIRRLEQEGTAATQVVLRSPVNGTVLERGVVEGQFVAADTPLLTVADLSRVWVMADLYEMDFTRLRVGDPARFTADALGGRSFDGRIQFIYPTVSSETRTLKARLALDNRGGVLRPGMYGRVRVSGRGGGLV